jgi:hypothetical protein
VALACLIGSDTFFGKYKNTTKQKHNITAINRGENFNPFDIW